MKLSIPSMASDILERKASFGFSSLGTVFLAVTGAKPCTRIWGILEKSQFELVVCSCLPCSRAQLFWSGSLLLSDHTVAFNPFFKLAPDWFLYPLVILAALSAIIASQALITGTYSLTRQAIQLGYLPRLDINHTSEEEIGQIYVPFVNWVLLASTVWLVVSFQSSSQLAAAYGIAVSATMTIATLMLFTVTVERWRWPLPLAGIFSFSLFVLILSFWQQMP